MNLLKIFKVLILSFIFLAEICSAQENKSIEIKFLTVEKSSIKVTKGIEKNTITISITNSSQYPKFLNFKFNNFSNKVVIAEAQISVDPQSTKTQVVPIAVGVELENKFSWIYSERVGDEKSTYLEISNKSTFHQALRINILNNESEIQVSQIFLQLLPSVTSIVKLEPTNDGVFTTSLKYVTRSTYGVFKPNNFNNKIAFPFFGTTKVSVCQSFDGVITTHSEDPMAYDFCAKEGSPIRAVADGRVYSVVDNFSEGGHRPELKDKANLVGIMDSNGIVYRYLHIVKDSAKVKVGDEVKMGQVIGEVGSVGYSSGPHLHLSVARVDENIKLKSMYVEFLNSRNQVINLRHKSIIVDGKVQ